MDGENVHVRSVTGTYPDQPGVQLDSDNIEAEVIEEFRLVRIRIVDAENPDFRLELVLEIDR
jgi:hypothetical protein